MKPNIDPITFEVIRNALASIADEMALIVMRSAVSPVVRDTMDYSTAVCDRDGQMIAQGLTLAVQLGAFPDIMRIITAEHVDGIRDGDVFIANDPYGSGGQHLPDIYIIKPIVIDNELRGFAATMAHHCDVGGLTPGSVAIHATDMHQEGLCLPLLKLYAAGQPNEAVFAIISRNTRLPGQVLGDIRAQLAACRAAEQGLTDLHSRYGADSLDAYFIALHDEAERGMRAAILSIPDGRHQFTDWIDGVGEDPVPLAIVVTVTVSGEEIDIDFDGTSAQIEAAINCPIAMARSASYCAIRCLGQEDIPNCEGYMRPVTIRAPEGTIVNPREPAACGARGVIGYRVFDAIMGALAAVAPDRVIAACEGGPTLFSVGGTHEGRPFVLTEVLVSTWGARATVDGLDGVSNPAANLSNYPVELVESELPLQVLSYGLVPDSGGAGRQRGGLAAVREFKFLCEKAQFTLRTDRRSHPPYGIAGGSAGGPSANTWLHAGMEDALPTMPMQSFAALRGDVVRLVSAGGGGYGSACERDPQAVLDDVLEARVSVDNARALYRVVIDPESGTIDADATRALRHQHTGE
jgi:N-methylhydantoinase B